MSHRATAPSPPQLTLAYQDATWTTGAGQVLHVVGSNLSTSTEVDVSSFATVTGKSYTALSGISGTLTVTMNIASVPASPINVTVTNGGHKAQGDLVTAGAIQANPTWSPEALCSDPADTYWQSTDMPVVADGTDMVSITPGIGNRGALTISRPPYNEYYSNRVGTEPALAGRYGNSSNNGVILWNTNYDFDIQQPWTLCMAWRAVSTAAYGEIRLPTSGSTAGGLYVIFSPGGGISNVYVAGSGQVTPVNAVFYPTETSRMILTCDGTDVRIKDASFGCDETTPLVAGTAVLTPGEVRNRKDIDVFSIIFMERGLSSAEVNLLDAYWANRYS